MSTNVRFGSIFPGELFTDVIFFLIFSVCGDVVEIAAGDPLLPQSRKKRGNPTKKMQDERIQFSVWKLTCLESDKQCKLPCLVCWLCILRVWRNFASLNSDDSSVHKTLTTQHECLDPPCFLFFFFSFFSFFFLFLFFSFFPFSFLFLFYHFFVVDGHPKSSEKKRFVDGPTAFTSTKVEGKTMKVVGLSTRWVFSCWVKWSRGLHSYFCPSVNSFEFQPCDHTPSGTPKLWFLIRCRRGHKANDNPRLRRYQIVFDPLNFRSWSMKTSLANAFAMARL